MALHERPHGAIVVDVRMPVDGERGAKTALTDRGERLHITDRLRELLVITTLDRFIEAATPDQSEQTELGG